MNTRKMITRALDFIRGIRPNNSEENRNRIELATTRFIVNLEMNAKSQKKVTNSLTFLMYSKENEALFI